MGICDVIMMLHNIVNDVVSSRKWSHSISRLFYLLFVAHYCNSSEIVYFHHLVLRPCGVMVFSRKIQDSSSLFLLFLSISWSSISKLYCFSFRFLIPKCCATGFLSCFLQFLMLLSWPLILRLIVCEVSPIYFLPQQWQVRQYTAFVLWQLKFPRIFKVTWSELVTVFVWLILSQIRQDFLLEFLMYQEDS